MSTVTIDNYVAGDSQLYDFHVSDESGPLDLTGATINWGIAKGKPSAIGDRLLTKTNGNGVQILNATLGQVRVSLGRGDFVDVGTFVHELEVTLASGDSYTAARGVFRSVPAVFAEGS